MDAHKNKKTEEEKEEAVWFEQIFRRWQVHGEKLTDSAQWWKQHLEGEGIVRKSLALEA